MFAVVWRRYLQVALGLFWWKTRTGGSKCVFLVLVGSFTLEAKGYKKTTSSLFLLTSPANIVNISWRTKHKDQGYFGMVFLGWVD